jgi:membrane protein insertase Oxa1/YidC/SpoIIIJ
MDLTITPRDAFAISFLESLPYLITIALVMITAYWQQKQTMARSQSQNPNQPAPPGQAIMKIFPLFFGFISFTLPAGLVVYFAASQAFRIGQQAVIIGMDDRKGEATTSPKPTTPAPKPEAETPKPETTKPKGVAPGSQAAGSAANKPAQRRPQGSKKKRGKKRRR